MKVNVALCCTCKMENEYIREYVQYYKGLGISKIFLYDNNDIDGEVLSEPIQDYIDEGFVEITDYRGVKTCLFKAYKDFYDKHNNEYDWLAYFDVDEYLTFADENMTLDKWLSDSRFNDTEIIHVNWMSYGNCGQYTKKEGGVQERFKTPILPLNKHIQYNDLAENNHIKSIIRGGLGSFSWVNPHSLISYDIKCKTASYEIGNSRSCFEPYDFSVAYLRHYVTKSLEEFITNKVKKGNCDRVQEKEELELHNLLERFEKYNG